MYTSHETVPRSSSKLEISEYKKCVGKWADRDWKERNVTFRSQNAVAGRTISRNVGVKC